MQREHAEKIIVRLDALCASSSTFNRQWYNHIDYLDHLLDENLIAEFARCVNHIKEHSEIVRAVLDEFPMSNSDDESEEPEENSVFFDEVKYDPADSEDESYETEVDDIGWPTTHHDFDQDGASWGQVNNDFRT